MGGPKKSFTYVYLPADVQEPIEEKSCTYTDENVVNCLTDQLKKHFAKTSTSGDALEKIKDEMRSGLGSAPVTDDMVNMAAGLTLVETVGVLPQMPATGNVGISFYCDDRGVMKGLPINRRASEIASICLGSPMQITGDTFVARVYETEEEFERRDFKVEELSSSSEWVRLASAIAAEKKKKDSPQVVMERMQQDADRRRVAPAPAKIVEITPAGEAKDRGNAHFKAGRYLEAVESYTEGIALDATIDVLYNNRAMSLLKLERFTEAEADCSKALELGSPHNPKALLRRGAARVALERPQEGLADFQAVLAREPANKEAKDWVARLT